MVKQNPHDLIIEPHDYFETPFERFEKILFKKKTPDH